MAAGSTSKAKKANNRDEGTSTAPLLQRMITRQENTSRRGRVESNLSGVNSWRERFGQQRVKRTAGGKGKMSFLAWIVLGLIAGFIASKMVNHTGEGIFLDIVLGIVGAVVGGWLFTAFGSHGGAVVVLFVYHALIRRTV
jgi:uncharacterized membrane protein YeaQ/YmgE (transglycosylase-associated protein family)